MLLNMRNGLALTNPSTKLSRTESYIACDQQHDQTCADIAFAFQEAVVDTLVIKCRRAMELTGHAILVIAGGVSANKCLQEKLQKALAKKGQRVCYARSEFCTTMVR